VLRPERDALNQFEAARRPGRNACDAAPLEEKQGAAEKAHYEHDCGKRLKKIHRCNLTLGNEAVTEPRA
jgi:hypothetical protein